ncbi:MAG: hypothetical protein HONBIEJF_01381 [Fimbriimonadaceae bacterium]|nr:hypothetical protein [Fimbriimonadaceae bacterium]
MKALTWIVVGASLAIVGCGGNSDNTGPNNFGNRYNREDRANGAGGTKNGSGDPAMQAMITKISTGNREFAIRLAKQLGSSTTANLGFAPYSISQALQMAAAGANSSTEQEMAKAINVNNLQASDRAIAANELAGKLKDADPAVQFDTANSVWIATGFPIRSDYLKEVSEKFQAKVSEVDFSQPETPATINNWVKEATKDKIDSIVPEKIEPNVRMYLINAVYFKGKWSTPFEKEATTEQDFIKADGSAVKAPLMRRNGMMKTYESDDLRGVWLPYGSDRFGMAVLVPKDGKSVSSVLDGLNLKTWRTLEQGAKTQQAMIVLPRFEVGSSIDLKQPLEALGMKQAFVADQADFSRMRSEKDLFITAVRHKAVIKVDEEGTEAAGATGVEVGVTSIPQYFEVVANKPFVFLIFDGQTETILFGGIVNDPTKKD